MSEKNEIYKKGRSVMFLAIDFMHIVIANLLLFGKKICQLRQTCSYLLQSLQFPLLLPKLTEFILALSLHDDVHIMIVTLLTIDYTYLSEETRCLLDLILTTIDNTSPSEQCTLLISNFQVITNDLTIFGECIFEARNKG
jgi:hypothetical protein